MHNGDQQCQMRCQAIRLHQEFFNNKYDKDNELIVTEVNI